MVGKSNHERLCRYMFYTQHFCAFGKVHPVFVCAELCVAYNVPFKRCSGGAKLYLYQGARRAVGITAHVRACRQVHRHGSESGHFQFLR